MNSAQTRKRDRSLRRLQHTVLMKALPWFNSRAAKKWCKETLGKSWDFMDHTEGRWVCLWAGHNDPQCYVFRFAEDKDRMWFTLRWAS